MRKEREIPRAWTKSPTTLSLNAHWLEGIIILILRKKQLDLFVAVARPFAA